jgi:hypothetical protein
MKMFKLRDQINWNFNYSVLRRKLFAMSFSDKFKFRKRDKLF